ncbi:MAG: hypothetical protein FRX48_09715 [Lasallia pustulata]|uniref:Mitochondrial carrier domain n=1 Tax=Lasallia pustulata TaxID=136370 RepID=A0A5M8PC77_9LECA|nr:MAG: hypothetical protein FRX48_09715 [Lasallia pustulata]
MSAAPREGPNPLRPYYVPPSIGLPTEATSHATAAHNIGGKHVSAAAAKATFGSSARDILSDLDYTDYLSDSSPSAMGIIKRLIDQALWKYTSVLLAQPFEVAKTVLQVQVAGAGQVGSVHRATADDMRPRPGSYRYDSYDQPSDDSDPDSPSYFTSTAPLSHTRSRSPRPRGRHRRPRSRSPNAVPSASPHKLRPRDSSSLLNVISQLWASEGAWGIWKGSNSTFIHSILYSTLTTWMRSLLAALVSLPDPSGLPTMNLLTPSINAPVGGLDILSSPSPLSSLLVAVSASALVSILLAPLDIARTYLILTPSTHPPRSLIPALQLLPSWTLPFSLAPVTLINSTLPTLISASTPLFLRSRLGIDPVLTPTSYSVATFVSQALELGVRLPVETVLRRGQIAVVAQGVKSTGRRPVETVTEVGAYRGVVGTMWHIVCEEGERDGRQELVSGTGGAPAVKATAAGKKRRKGQGLGGLWRGWRVGVWGLVGVWGAAALGGVGGKGAEF